MGVGLDLAAGLDPARFARLAGLEPDDWQTAALRSRSARALWCCARQTGKSTVAGVLACHRALFTPNSLTLLISPSERQSKELMAKVTRVFGAVGRPVPADAETKLSLELATGARICALPGAERTVRGYSAPSLVVIDEASRVGDDLYHALTPMLATNPAARLLAISTPAGMAGWWFAAWTEGGDLWERVRVTAAECRRISARFLALEQAAMPASVFSQEYECVFSAVEDGAFRAEDVFAMLSDDIEPRFPEPAPADAPDAAAIAAYLT